jgi:hypothetical protein
VQLVHDARIIAHNAANVLRLKLNLKGGWDGMGEGQQKEGGQGCVQVQLVPDARVIAHNAPDVLFCDRREQKT